MQTAYYPMKFVINRAATCLLGARDIEGGVVDYLRGLGIDQVGWRDQFFVRPPGANERAFFNLSDRVQVAMLDVRRTGYDEEGNPIRVTVTVYPGDRNQFEREAGKVPPPPGSSSHHHTPYLLMQQSNLCLPSSYSTTRFAQPGRIT